MNSGQLDILVQLLIIQLVTPQYAIVLLVYVTCSVCSPVAVINVLRDKKSKDQSVNARVYIANLFVM